MTAQRRTAEHYLHGQVVVVPGRIAAWLGQHGLDGLRVRARGIDAEVDAVLLALHVAALDWRTSVGAEAGSEVDGAGAEAAPDLTLMNTKQAAERLGVTDRAVRLAIAEHRLPAALLEGRWRIQRTDLEHYAAARAA